MSNGYQHILVAVDLTEESAKVSGRATALRDAYKIGRAHV